MFWRIGMQTFYGPAFICDLSEIANEMLPYTKAAFGRYFEDYATWEIRPSSVWYDYPILMKRRKLIQIISKMMKK